MSEKITHSGEHHLAPKNHPEAQPIPTTEVEHKTHEHHDSVEKVAKIHETIEKQAISGKEIAKTEFEQPKSEHNGHVGKDLKHLTFERTMRRTRKKLSAPDKALSSLIHQPVVDKVSEFSAKTVARPSGLFGGSLFALIGTSLLLYLTRKYGYEFNYLALLLLFVLGFCVGMLLEMLFKLMFKRSRHN